MAPPAPASAKKYFPKNAAGTQADLVKFTAFMADERARPQVGRAWAADELRLKSHDDLHKLWFVLLQEKNKLRSDELMSIQLQQIFYGRNNLYKVRKSMARLLTVVNERKKIRNEYRRHLEDSYIQTKKAEESAAQEARYAELKEQGFPVPLGPDDVAKMLKARTERKEKKYENIRNTFMEKFDSKTVAPLLDEQDVSFVAQTSMRMTQKDILKKHVKNWSDLNLKQRRSVMGHIQAQRSKHAKSIFLKELAAIGSQQKLN